MLEIIILVMIGGYAISEVFHRRERKDLLNRIMSRNFEEYQYYDKKYTRDLKEVDTLRKDIRKEQRIEAELPAEKLVEEKEAYEKFTKGLEEDWSEDEIDKKKVSEIINKD